MLEAFVDRTVILPTSLLISEATTHVKWMCFCKNQAMEDIKRWTADRSEWALSYLFVSVMICATVRLWEEPRAGGVRGTRHRQEGRVFKWLLFGETYCTLHFRNRQAGNDDGGDGEGGEEETEREREGRRISSVIIMEWQDKQWKKIQIERRGGVLIMGCLCCQAGGGVKTVK